MAKFFKAHNCVNCVKKSIIFGHLSKSELKLIDNNRYEVNYNPGEIIFKQGTPCNHVVSFVSGLAKVYIEGLNEKNLILKINPSMSVR